MPQDPKNFSNLFRISSETWKSIFVQSMQSFHAFRNYAFMFLPYKAEFDLPHYPFFFLRLPSLQSQLQNDEVITRHIWIHPSQQKENYELRITDRSHKKVG
jgi:hypothetical protein